MLSEYADYVPALFMFLPTHLLVSAPSGCKDGVILVIRTSNVTITLISYKEIYIKQKQGVVAILSNDPFPEEPCHVGNF